MLFSCNPNGKLCLGGPCYSSRTVNHAPVVPVTTKTLTSQTSPAQQLYILNLTGLVKHDNNDDDDNDNDDDNIDDDHNDDDNDNDKEFSVVQ